MRRVLCLLRDYIRLDPFDALISLAADTGTALFLPLYALDVYHHHRLVVREAILGEEVRE
jgi:hypothetical protein